MFLDIFIGRIANPYDAIVRHVYKANNLVTDKQWAYRAGFSTELLLIQLTETWREAVDAGLVVALPT